MAVAVVGEHLVAVLVGDIRPHVITGHEAVGLKRLREDALDEFQVERLELALRDPEEDVDVGRLQRVFDAPLDAVRGFLTELPEDDRRGTSEIVERAKLKIKEDGNRNGDRRRQRGRQAEAPVAHDLREVHIQRL